MSTLFGILFLASLISLIIGLINPSYFKKLFKGRDLSRKFILKVFGTATAVLFFAIGFSAGPSNEESGQKPSDQQQVTIPAENEVVAPEKIESVPVINNELENSITTSTEKNDNPPQVARVAVVEQVSVIALPVINQVVATKTSEFLFYSVSRVIDGDTVEIDMGGKRETLRLIGVDTPEITDPRKPVQCFGVEASSKGESLLVGKKIRIETDPTQGERDKYGRLLAYIYREDGLFYNKQMIEQGYAHEYTYNIPYKYQTEFKAAQKSAQENKRGLWSPDTCNGDTTKSVITPVSSNDTGTPSDSVTPSGKFYTSSFGTSKYYYSADCSGWKSLSAKYLVSFDSLEALLAVYPNKTLSSQCE